MIPALLAGKAAGGPLIRLIIVAVLAVGVIWVAPDLLDVAVDAGGDALGATVDAVVDAGMGVVDWFADLVANELNPF